jgi:hypothetical protein
MKLYIPSVSDQIQLQQPWTFELYNEYRNEKLINHFCNKSHDVKLGCIALDHVTIPAKTILRIDRIFIRKGESAEYNSISFIINSCPEIPEIKGARFWARLHDCNEIHFDRTCTILNKKIYWARKYYNYTEHYDIPGLEQGTPLTHLAFDKDPIGSYRSMHNKPKYEPQIHHTVHFGTVNGKIRYIIHMEITFELDPNLSEKELKEYWLRYVITKKIGKLYLVKDTHDLIEKGSATTIETLKKQAKRIQGI